jgi:hypothetical protein
MTPHDVEMVRQWLVSKRGIVSGYFETLTGKTLAKAVFAILEEELEDDAKEADREFSKVMS